MNFSILAVLVFLTAIIIAAIFVRKRSVLQPSAGSSDVFDLDAAFNAVSKPAIAMKTTAEETQSFLGGTLPKLAGFDWPSRSGCKLSLLAKISCSDLPQVPELDWLPSEGVLLFFADLNDRSWVCDPQDREGWRVIYFDSNLQALEEQSISTIILPKEYLKFSRCQLPPNRVTTVTIEQGITEDPDGLLMDYRSRSFDSQPEHQMGGYPASIHETDLEFDCQMASNGLYPSIGNGHDDQRFEKPTVGAGEWNLLLQLAFADDEHFDLMCLGNFYFMIRNDDAKARHFDKSWLICQYG